MNIQTLQIKNGDVLVVHGYFDEKAEKALEARIREAFTAAGIKEVPVMFLPLEVGLTVLKR